MEVIFKPMKILFFLIKFSIAFIGKKSIFNKIEVGSSKFKIIKAKIRKDNE